MADPDRDRGTAKGGAPAWARFRGLSVDPYWRVLPPDVEPAARGSVGGVPVLRIAPSPAFGTGEHPTTHLCLLALGALWRTGPAPARVLDFGAGSGILAIGAARLGASVEAVEIDGDALAAAATNARLNDVEDRIEWSTTLREPAEPFDLVLANILSEVLLDFADALCARTAPTGRLVLSGLTATDVPSLVARYGPRLPGHRHRIYERDEWRALVFAPDVARP